MGPLSKEIVELNIGSGSGSVSVSVSHINGNGIDRRVKSKE